MKTKKGFMLRKVADKNVVVPIGQASVDFNGIINLNDTGAFLWNILSKGCTYDELVSSVLSEYDVNEDIAKHDIDVFLKTARDADVIED